MSLFNPLEPPPGYGFAPGSACETSTVASRPELDRIAAALSESSTASVVLVLGPAGASKTALVAGALQEVARRFSAVIGFHARSTPLDLDDVLRKLDIYLTQRSPDYRDHSGREPLSAVHVEPNDQLSGQARRDRLRANLIHTLRRSPVLIVLDGFQMNLDTARAGDPPPSLNPAWDELLAALVAELPEGGSQLLLTSRKQLLSLSAHHRVQSIHVQGAQGRVDDAIDAVSAPAKRLLWVLTRAAEPVAERLLSGVWSGQSFEDEMLRQIAASIAAMPKELVALAPALPPQLRARLDALADKPAPDAPPLRPLVDELVRAGLITREGQGETAIYSFMPVVAESASAWGQAHPHHLAGRTEVEVWQGYGERYATLFQGLSVPDQLDDSSLQAQSLNPQAAEAGVRAARYLIRAGAIDGLFTLLGTGRLTNIADPMLFAELLGDLQSTSNQMAKGEPRFSLRAHLADVLHEAKHKPRALDLYAQAVEEADELGHWAEVGRIAQNWAAALRGSGKPSVAVRVFRRAAKALRAAEQPELNAIAAELEALRIEVHRGQAEQALPDLERHLSELRSWWRRHRAGESLAQAPDPQALARAFTTALHLSTRADQTLERWQECLDRFAELDQAEHEAGLGAYERARTRVNRCRPLLELGRMDEAQAVLEECLKLFLAAGDETRQAAALSALADLWDERRDLDQAIAIERQALAVREIIADPEARAISHQNLAGFLDKANCPEEAARHRLAALVCRAVSGQDMGATIGSLSADIRQAAARGQRYELPRLGAVLASPGFASLRRFLEARELAIAPLQAAIDRLIEQIHRPVED